MFLHIIDISISKSIGLKRYFTGIPCSLGGIGERLVNGSKCCCSLHIDKNRNRASKWTKENLASAQEYKRNWRIKNRSKLKQQSEDYRKQKRAEIIAYRQDYYRANSDKLRKKFKSYYEENKDKILASNKIWAKSNTEKMREYSRKSRIKRRIAEREYRRKYYLQNQDKLSAKRARRRAVLRNSIPTWYGEIDEFVLSEAYKVCRLRKESSGISWHVDHCIPLKAKNTCGLHVWNNFQVIPAKINISKQNRLIYTQPHEWITDIPKFFNVIAA